MSIIVAGLSIRGDNKYLYDVYRLSVDELKSVSSVYYLIKGNSGVAVNILSKPNNEYVYVTDMKSVNIDIGSCDSGIVIHSIVDRMSIKYRVSSDKHNADECLYVSRNGVFKISAVIQDEIVSLYDYGISINILNGSASMKTSEYETVITSETEDVSIIINSLTDTVLHVDGSEADLTMPLSVLRLITPSFSI